MRPVAQRASCPRCRAVFRGRLRHCPADGAALQPLPRDPQVGAMLAGRYAIEAIVGETSLGRVYRARDARGGGARLVHVMYGEYAALDEYARLFADHAERSRPLAAANIVAPLDAGVTETGLPYLVTHLVGGRRLATVIRAEAPLEPRRAVHLVRDVLAALQHIHGRGPVHGDLTSAHVVVTCCDDGLETAVVELARPGNRLGTPPYRAPEQGVAERPDARSDLYAVGVLLYELLTGAPPFGGSALAQALASATGTPPPMSRRVPGLAVDPGVERVALRLLSRSPEARYPTADATLAALASTAL